MHICLSKALRSKLGGYIESPEKYGGRPEEGLWQWVQKGMYVREISEDKDPRLTKCRRGMDLRGPGFSLLDWIDGSTIWEVFEENNTDLVSVLLNVSWLWGSHMKMLAESWQLRSRFQRWFWSSRRCWTTIITFMEKIKHWTGNWIG